MNMPRTDIRYLNSVRYYTTYFFILPNYNFEKNLMETGSFYKSYVMVFSLTYVGLNISWMSVNYDEVFPKMVWITKFILLVIDSSSIGMFGIAVYSIIVKRKRWEKFFKAFRLLDVMLQSKSVQKSCIGGFFLSFILGHLCVLTFYLFCVYYLWFEKRRSLVSLIPAISSLHFFSLTTVIADIAFAIKIRYDLIYDHLTNNQNTKDNLTFLKKIERCKMLYELNGSIINLFNKIFGWYILIIQCRTIAVILRNMDSIVDGFDWQAFDKFVNIFMSLVLVYATLMLVFRCHDLKAVADKIHNFCCLQYFNAKRDSEEFEHLEILFDAVKDQPKISAAGFFEIDRSLLLSTLNILTTYFIVLVQVHTDG